MRTKVTTVVIAAVMAVSNAGCGSDSPSSPAVSMQIEQIQAENELTKPMVDEIGFRSLADLVGLSALVVVARPVGKPVPLEPGFDWISPTARLTFVVEKVLKGNDVAPRIDLAVGSALVDADIDDENLTLHSYGGVETSQFDPAQTYLMFLSDAGRPRLWTPTSVLVGAMPKLAGVGFVKPTKDYPGIPDLVDEAAVLAVRDTKAAPPFAGE